MDHKIKPSIVFQSSKVIENSIFKTPKKYQQQFFVWDVFDSIFWFTLKRVNQFSTRENDEKSSLFYGR